MKTRTVRMKCHTEFELTSDARFVGAVEVAIHHAAQHNQMAADSEAALIHMACDLCHAAFVNANGHNPALRVAVREYEDRVEVLLEDNDKLLPAQKKAKRREAAPAVMNGFAPAGSQAEAAPNGVDRVMREESGRTTRIILVQYSHAHQTHS